jgi:ABC-2 type transport system ATP-binding protein
MNSEKDIAIEVKNVSKTFMLPTNKAGSIKNVFTNIFRTSIFKGYETQKALEGISFTVKKGEFFGIVGRNGSGKSTLLKMLAGIYQPTKGTIRTHGKIVPFIELGVGFNPELTGKDNVYLNGALLGFTDNEIDDKYQDIVDFAELERFMSQRLKNYSSGMQVRLAFSVATVLADSDILLLDEVLAVGDADFQRKCFNYFNTLKKNKKTVIFVSHDMGAVREYCDKAVLIDSGEIVAIGKSDSVATEYTKLFARPEIESERSSEEDQDDRWGNNKARISDINVSSTKDDITVKIKIGASGPIGSCVVGIRIKDAIGEHITGTNTKLEKIKNLDFKKKEEKLITWIIPNILSDGKFYLDVAVTSFDETTVYDWWSDAVSFTITKNRHVPYSVDPGFKAVVRSV